MMQQLTDRTALLRNRARARHSDHFLQVAAADEVIDHLRLVKRTFSLPAIVTPFPEVWAGRLGNTPTITPDDDVLDLNPGAHDLVVHSMSLHWSNDPVGQLIQCRRALKADGFLVALSLGGQTLHELRACLAEAEAASTGGISPRVAPMAEVRDMGALLQRAGFALPVADSTTLSTTYQSALHLMRDLRRMGEANALSGRIKSFTRQSIIYEAARRYEEAFGTDDGRVSATFELITLTGWAPHASQPQALRPGSATTRLADALGSAEVPVSD